MATPAKLTLKKVKPILSINREDARKRAIALYRAYYRQIPQTLIDYDIPRTQEQCKQKLREEFRKRQHMSDLRIIDITILKAQIQLQEISEVWMPKGRLMDIWKETTEPIPEDFMTKFLKGQDSVV
ncbi:NADH dehydrogenase (ubiquinone) B14 subunit [Augochlora pura]